MTTKLINPILAVGLLMAATSAFSAISPDDGMKFEPYAISAGLMDEMGRTCFSTDKKQLSTILNASLKLNKTLVHFGMPPAEYRADYLKGQSSIKETVKVKSMSELCTPKVRKALLSWDNAITGAVEKLNNEDAQN